MTKDEEIMQMRSKIQSMDLELQMLRSRPPQRSIHLSDLMVLLHRKKEIPIAVSLTNRDDQLLYRHMVGVKRGAIELCEAMWGMECARTTDVMVNYNKEVMLKKLIAIVLEVFSTAATFGITLDEAVQRSLLAEIRGMEPDLSGMI